MRLRPAFACLLALAAGLPVAQARLGETLAQLSERFGKPAGTPKNSAYWLFESGDAGQLQYTVTFDGKKKSMAEGLKPIRNARFTARIAEDFISTQLETELDSKTRRVVPAGEKYSFAGQTFVCDPNEYVVTDESRGLLIIWSRAAKTPFILVLSPEMLREQTAAAKK